MNVNTTDFDSLEQQFVEFIGEFKSISSTECRLRELLRMECSRAENAEAARDAAERAASEARTSAAAATAGATQAAAMLNIAHEQIIDLKTQLDISEHQRKALENRCSEMLNQKTILERELHQLRQLQLAHTNLQQQYVQLQERVINTTEDACREKTQLENEFRRIEKCAAGGMEIRERARLAAVAHTRERRLVTAELQHVSRELMQANAELTKLKTMMAEQQVLSDLGHDTLKVNHVNCNESLSELRALLEAERAGTEKLERALAAALKDNLSLATNLNSNDNVEVGNSTDGSEKHFLNICEIDSFLAE